MVLVVAVVAIAAAVHAVYVANVAVGNLLTSTGVEAEVGEGKPTARLHRVQCHCKLSSGRSNLISFSFDIYQFSIELLLDITEQSTEISEVSQFD
ncbi:Hypothetical predicted protein [Octopus vulgaris]|uniref:Secreted protein n=1 Tax=Octopus vulgaris TaxID=6645 RepID=A0AA36BG81_OCTVU|nr:Hypothetical predicted protein [Octopus vulgaris]